MFKNLSVIGTRPVALFSTVTEIHGNSSNFFFIGDWRSAIFVKSLGGAFTNY